MTPSSSSPRVNAPWPRRTGTRSASVRTSSLGSSSATTMRIAFDPASIAPSVVLPGGIASQTSTLAPSDRCRSPPDGATRRYAAPASGHPGGGAGYFFAGGLLALPDPDPAAGFAGPALSGILTLSVLVRPSSTSTLMPDETPSLTACCTYVGCVVSSSTNG